METNAHQRLSSQLLFLETSFMECLFKKQPPFRKRLLHKSLCRKHLLKRSTPSGGLYCTLVTSFLQTSPHEMSLQAASTPETSQQEASILETPIQEVSTLEPSLHKVMSSGNTPSGSVSSGKAPSGSVSSVKAPSGSVYSGSV